MKNTIFRINFIYSKHFPFHSAGSFFETPQLDSLPTPNKPQINKEASSGLLCYAWDVLYLGLCHSQEKCLRTCLRKDKEFKHVLPSFIVTLCLLSLSSLRQKYCLFTFFRSITFPFIHSKETHVQDQTIDKIRKIFSSTIKWNQNHCSSSLSPSLWLFTFN